MTNWRLSFSLKLTRRRWLNFEQEQHIESIEIIPRRLQTTFTPSSEPADSQPNTKIRISVRHVEVKSDDHSLLDWFEVQHNVWLLRMQIQPVKQLILGPMDTVAIHQAATKGDISRVKLNESWIMSGMNSEPFLESLAKQYETLVVTFYGHSGRPMFSTKTNSNCPGGGHYITCYMDLRTGLALVFDSLQSGEKLNGYYSQYFNCDVLIEFLQQVMACINKSAGRRTRTVRLSTAGLSRTQNTNDCGE